MELVLVFGVLAVGSLVSKIGLRAALEGAATFALCGLLAATIGWVLSYYM